MIKLYKQHFALAAVVIVGGLSTYSHFGPAQQFGLGRTGSPFDGSTCSSCHGGGSFSATMNIQLLQGSPAVIPNVAVTSYVPGSSYTLRISRTAVGVPGPPNPGGFGFQVTCATLPPSNTNVNAWGAVPINTHSINLGSGSTLHTYVEHSDKLSASIADEDIPWTGPASGTGTVKFYAAVNTVNGNGGTTGDQVLSSSLQVTMNPLPMTWLYFRGKEDAGNVLLEWATSNEINNNFYTIEKSSDGQHFGELVNIDAKSDLKAINTYSYTDAKALGNAYYRIKQTDVSGNVSYFRTIQVKTGVMAKANHYLMGNAIVLQLPSEGPKNIKVNLFSVNGQLISSQAVTLIEGSNSIQIEKPNSPGLYLLQADKEYTGTVLVP